MYDYRCERCSTQFEVRQSFSDDTLTVCPPEGGPASCTAPGEGPVKKVFSGVAISFKGDGFYKNDHGANAKSRRKEKESASSSNGSSSESKDSSSSSKDSSSKDSSPPARMPAAPRPTPGPRRPRHRLADSSPTGDRPPSQPRPDDGSPPASGPAPARRFAATGS